MQQHKLHQILLLSKLQEHHASNFIDSWSSGLNVPCSASSPELRKGNWEPSLLKNCVFACWLKMSSSTIWACLRSHLTRFIAAEAEKSYCNIFHLLTHGPSLTSLLKPNNETMTVACSRMNSTIRILHFVYTHNINPSSRWHHNNIEPTILA